jgi:hypothetical protein
MNVGCVNFTVSLREGKEHGYFVLALLGYQMFPFLGTGGVAKK